MGAFYYYFIMSGPSLSSQPLVLNPNNIHADKQNIQNKFHQRFGFDLVCIFDQPLPLAKS